MAGTTFAMGWTPEYKFIGARWDIYCELMMMYLLAIAAAGVQHSARRRGMLFRGR